MFAFAYCCVGTCFTPLLCFTPVIILVLPCSGRVFILCLHWPPLPKLSTAAFTPDKPLSFPSSSAPCCLLSLASPMHRCHHHCSACVLVLSPLPLQCPSSRSLCTTAPAHHFLQIPRLFRYDSVMVHPHAHPQHQG